MKLLGEAIHQYGVGYYQYTNDNVHANYIFLPLAGQVILWQCGQVLGGCKDLDGEELALA